MRRQHRRGVSLIDLGLTVLFVVLLAAILVPNFVRTSCGSPITACKSNLKNIGTATEMYATDWGGAFPPTAQHLTPNYLRTIPTCPSAQSDTYSAHYLTRNEPVPEVTVACPAWRHEDPAACQARLVEQDHLLARHRQEHPDEPFAMELATCPEGSPYYYRKVNGVSYHFYCAGHNHKGMELPPDYPRYDFQQGLISRPD